MLRTQEQMICEGGQRVNMRPRVCVETILSFACDVKRMCLGTQKAPVRPSECVVSPETECEVQRLWLEIRMLCVRTTDCVKRSRS